MLSLCTGNPGSELLNVWGGGAEMQQVIIKRIILIKSVIFFNPLGWSTTQAALGARFRTNIGLCFPCN